MANEADDIALAVLEEFRKLTAKRKPAVRDNGLREWVPLSGIVVKGKGFLETSQLDFVYILTLKLEIRSQFLTMCGVGVSLPP
jgi:hypothetical protein